VRWGTSLLVVAALLSGCGSGGGASHSASTQVTAATKQYFAAMANGDAARACSLLTAAAKARLRRGASCPGLVAEVHSRLPPAALAAFRNVRVSTPAVSGGRATVQARTATLTQTVVLVSSSGRWLIERVSAQGAG
jgi:hypothetical protein